MAESGSKSAEASLSLTEAEKDRIEKNRNRALHLKASKLISHPYAKA